jgi:hypothetical protein
LLSPFYVLSAREREVSRAGYFKRFWLLIRDHCSTAKTLSHFSVIKA